jgi:hypothetical protein
MRINSFYDKRMRITSIVCFLVSLIVPIGLSIVRVNCISTKLSYGINVVILINLFILSFNFYDLLMAFWYYEFFPEGVGCDIEYYYNYTEAKLAQIVLSIIIYALLACIAKNKVGCEVFLSMAVSTVFVLLMDYIRCSVGVVLFWLLLFIMSLAFIFMFTNFKIVFIGLVVCVPLKVIEYILYID